jgi:hypothetical protein
MLVCAGRLSRGGPTNRGLLSLGLRGLGNLSRSGRRSGRAHRRCPCGRDCHLAALEHPDDMARRVHRIRPQGQDLKAPGGGRLSAIGGTPTKGQPTRKCFRGARATVVSSSRRGNSLPSHTDLPPHGMETSATTPKWSDAHKPVEVLAVVPMRVARAVLTAGVIVRIKSMRIEAVDVGLSRSAACPHVSPGSLRLASLQESRIASMPGEITVTAARASCI